LKKNAVIRDGRTIAFTGSANGSRETSAHACELWQENARNEKHASLGRKRKDVKYSPHENTLFSLTMFSSDDCSKRK
jgi:hypothetical protein